VSGGWCLCHIALRDVDVEGRLLDLCAHHQPDHDERRRHCSCGVFLCWESHGEEKKGSVVALTERKLLIELYKEIENDNFGPDKKFLTQPCVVCRYKVGPTMVKRVWGFLKRQGLVEVRPGHGTFLTRRPKPVVFTWDDTAVLDQDRTDMRWRPRVEGSLDRLTCVDLTEQVEAPPEVAKLLEVESGTELVRQTRTMSWANKPTVVCQSWRPALPSSDGVPGQATWQSGSVAVEERFSGRPATSRDALTLDIDPGTPVFEASHVIRDPHGRPVEVVRHVGVGHITFVMPTQKPKTPLESQISQEPLKSQCRARRVLTRLHDVIVKLKGSLAGFFRRR
jgi:DNA-binding GntR family transcriptional regulator